MSEGATAPVDVLVALTRLAEEMAGRHPLESLLSLIANRTAEILGAARVSVRLFNPAQTHLLAVARAGQPLHERPQEFRVGEGLIGFVASRGEVLRTGEPEAHPSFVRRPGMPERMGWFLGVPIRAGTVVSGVLSVVDPNVELTETHEHIACLIAALSAPYVEMARLSRLSRVDPLTGALSRRGLDEDFPEVVADAPGPIVPLGVVAVDVDGLARLNSVHGHAVGDLVLKHVATLLAGVLRGGDAVVRMGGGRFLLVLPKAALEPAAAVAERARVKMRMMPAAIPGGSVPVTLSLGVAERRAGERREALLARAEEALARAKKTGKDRVVRAL